MPRKPSLVALLFCSAMLAGCAAEPPSPMRLMIKLAQPLDDAASITRLVSSRAGVPARYVAASSASWHAVALECGGPGACEAALQRLRAERSVFEAVERDERKRIVTP